MRGQRPRVDREGVATATPCLGRFLAVPEPPRSWSSQVASPPLKAIRWPGPGAWRWLGWQLSAWASSGRPQPLLSSWTPCLWPHCPGLQGKTAGDPPRALGSGGASSRLASALALRLLCPMAPSCSFLLGSCHRLSLPLSWPTCPGLSVLPSSDACTPPGQNRPLGLLQNRPPTLPSLFCFKDFLCFLLSFSVPSFHPF